MTRSRDSKQIIEAAEDIIARAKELGSPKDALCALLIAHVKLSLDNLADGVSVEQHLAAYNAAFKDTFAG